MISNEYEWIIKRKININNLSKINIRNIAIILVMIIKLVDGAKTFFTLILSLISKSSSDSILKCLNNIYLKN
jgi:hypothetical protein